MTKDQHKATVVAQLNAHTIETLVDNLAAALEQIEVLKSELAASKAKVIDDDAQPVK